MYKGGPSNRHARAGGHPVPAFPWWESKQLDSRFRGNDGIRKAEVFVTVIANGNTKPMKWYESSKSFVTMFCNSR
jgi:hypothetical protein